MTALAADARSASTSPVAERVNGVHPDWLRYQVPIITEPVDKHLSLRLVPVAPTGETVAPDSPTGHPPTVAPTDQSPRPTPASVAKAVAPLVVVNALAVYGQLAYALDHIAPTDWYLPARIALSVGFAAAVEAVALYVGWHAHDALLLRAYSTARWLRRVSFALAAGVGAMNYAHFAAPGFQPTAAACAFGLLSLLSPWMWGLHTRRQQHIQLLKERKVDETGAEFSLERRRAFPVRTWQARRWSIDNNVTDPVAAWEGFKADRLARPVVIEGETVAPTEVRPVAPDWPITVAPDRLLPVVPLSPPTVAEPALTVAPDPVAPTAEPDQSPRPVATPTRRPSPRPVARPAKAVAPTEGHSPAAVANAAALRAQYPDRLVDSDYAIRKATGWSFDRFTKAKAAYEADADRQTPTGATS